jgi:ABC-type proline/glycine betaine transport system substrate-binding protein
MALPRELAAKLGKPIRLLASNSQGEAFAALCASRLLESHGYTFSYTCTTSRTAAA